MTQFIDRESVKTLESLSKSYPVVVVMGPRQTGKTTLVRNLFRNKPYVLLEDPDAERMATSDPRSFLARFPSGAILDEIQRVPDIMRYLQGIVDVNPTPGQFILTGSNHLLLGEQVSQSLAGRSGHLFLLPFGYRELAMAGRAPKTIEEAIFRGGYPSLHTENRDPVTWLSDYILTYVERDARAVTNLRDLAAFKMMMALCAGSIGQTVEFSRLGSDCGVSRTTASQWISIMENCGIIYLLRPYFANFGKRWVKTPKIYFTDTGLACRLLGIESPAQIRTHFAVGFLFENWILAEFLKTNFNLRLDWKLHFFRTWEGLEVDLLLEKAGSFHGFELKAGRTFSPDWCSALSKWRSLMPPGTFRSSNICFSGDESFRFNDHNVLSWKTLPDGSERWMTAGDPKPPTP